MTGGRFKEYHNGQIELQVDRLRYSHNALYGELTVIYRLSGAQKGHPVLSVGEFNFSSVQAASTRAKLLKELAKTNGNVDWLAHIEDFRQSVILTERQGEPAVDLRTFKSDGELKGYRVDQFIFPAEHPNTLFTFGDSLKSYFLLYVLGCLSRQGINVALIDWEMDGESHSGRLRRIFGADWPKVLYCRCEKPITEEVDRIQRIRREHEIQYFGYDSAGVACGGDPSNQEMAINYYRAVRAIGGGSTTIAHVPADNGEKVFGSIFWFNMARAVWHVNAGDPDADGTREIELTNKKSNLSLRGKKLAYSVAFTPDRRTTFTPIDKISAVFGEDKSVRTRILNLVRTEARTPKDISELLGIQKNTVDKTIGRNSELFYRFSDGRIGPKEGRDS